MKKNCFLIHTHYLVNKDCHAPSLRVFAKEILCVGVLHFAGEKLNQEIFWFCFNFLECMKALSTLFRIYVFSRDITQILLRNVKYFIEEIFNYLV